MADRPGAALDPHRPPRLALPRTGMTGPTCSARRAGRRSATRTRPSRARSSGPATGPATSPTTRSSASRASYVALSHELRPLHARRRPDRPNARSRARVSTRSSTTGSCPSCASAEHRGAHAPLHRRGRLLGATSRRSWAARVFGAGVPGARARPRAQPFALVADTYEPHEPWTPPRAYIDLYGDPALPRPRARHEPLRARVSELAERRAAPGRCSTACATSTPPRSR